jgi:uroporphyrinogen-III decarboxylase
MIRPQMTSRERVLAALARRPTDRPAFGSPTSVIVEELMDLCGAAFPEAHQQAPLMARLAATAHTELRHDILMPYFSVQHEAAALGCRIDWGRRDPCIVPRILPVAEAMLALVLADAALEQEKYR